MSEPQSVKRSILKDIALGFQAALQELPPGYTRDSFYWRDKTQSGMEFSAAEGTQSL